MAQLLSTDLQTLTDAQIAALKRLVDTEDTKRKEQTSKIPYLECLETDRAEMLRVLETYPEAVEEGRVVQVMTHNLYDSTLDDVLNELFGFGKGNEILVCHAKTPTGKYTPLAHILFSRAEMATRFVNNSGLSEYAIILTSEGWGAANKQH